MEEDLISKKELLALTGISYGALYRWKRKKLIPEEWFLKKSTFTGPETFFPRKLVLERIAKIQEMKEDFSLDDLAQTFSGAPPEGRVTPRTLLERGLVSKAIENLTLYVPAQELDFYGALYLCLCDKLLTDGSLSLSEVDVVLAHLLADFKSFDGAPVLTVYRKMGLVFTILADGKAKIAVDPDAKQIVVIPTAAFWETLKTKWIN